MTCPTCGCRCGEVDLIDSRITLFPTDRILVIDTGDKAASVARRMFMLAERIRPVVEQMGNRVDEVRAKVEDFHDEVKALSRDDDRMPFHQRLNRKAWEKR